MIELGNTKEKTIKYKTRMFSRTDQLTKTGVVAKLIVIIRNIFKAIVL